MPTTGIKNAELARHEDLHVVFVYGTLMSGFGNNQLLANAEFIGKAETSEARFNVYCNGGFPYMVEGGEHRVVGELWGVTDEQLQRCHRLEGHPQWYRATVVPVNHEVGHAMAYIMTQDVSNARLLPDGDWRKNGRNSR